MLLGPCHRETDEQRYANCQKRPEKRPVIYEGVSLLYENFSHPSSSSSPQRRSVAILHLTSRSLLLHPPHMRRGLTPVSGLHVSLCLSVSARPPIEAAVRVSPLFVHRYLKEYLPRTTPLPPPRSMQEGHWASVVLLNVHWA